VQEYTLVLERGQLKEMRTVLRYNYAFSNDCSEVLCNFILFDLSVALNNK